MHHRFYSALAVMLLACGAGSASANLLFYDSFNYSAGSLGTVGSPTWVKSGGSTADPTVQNVGGLTYTGLQVSSDTFSLQYDGSGISPSPAASDGTTLSPITTGSVYYSLLMKVPTVTVTGGNGFSTAGNLTSGSFMTGLQTLSASATPNNLNTAAPLQIRSGDGTQGSATYQLGTSKTSTAADRQWYTTQSFTTGVNAETVFVVLEYTFDSVNGDSAKLFINPVPGAVEPAPQLTVTAGSPLTVAGGIASFFVRNNSVEPDRILIDELRIGTLWADVTPAAVPEMSAAFFMLAGCAIIWWICPR